MALAQITGGLLVFALSAGAVAAQPCASDALPPCPTEPLPQALTAQRGDPVQGRRIVASRQTGLCLLCHSGPLPEERFQGTLAPSLAGAGTRWSAEQLRLRLMDSRRINPDSVMPAYHSTEGFHRVAKNWMDRPILSAQQIEDVVAYLLTLRD